MDNIPAKQKSVVISAIGADGAIVETTYQPDKKEVRLIIAREGVAEELIEWQELGTVYSAVRSSNNLIRHQALLLPSAATEYDSTETLLTDIGGYLSRYVSLEKEAIELVAIYVLLTWVYDAFNELPYLRFRGDYGTGKTRALLVAGSLCYKAFFASGASTVSPIFHTLDTFKGTLIFDEADFRFTDEKAELVKILNNGNSKGFPVLRTQLTPSKEFDPRAFAIFGPKLVAMRRSYDDRALESRFLTIEMEPGRSGDAPINLPDAQKMEALELRNKLLMYRFRNRLEVTPEPSYADPSLEARLNQIILPLLSVAPSTHLRNSIKTVARDLQRTVVLDRGGSSDGQVLSIVADLLAGEGTMSVAEIQAAFVRKYGDDYERAITNRWIGKALRRLSLRLYKSNGIIILAPKQQERIAALCARYGIQVNLDPPGLGR